MTKKKRIEDPELLEVVRGLPCMACGQTPCHPHHLRSRGAGGDDIAENVIPLCAGHHSLIHQRGANYMADQFPCVKNWLDLAGWEWDDFMEHWTWQAPPKRYHE